MELLIKLLKDHKRDLAGILSLLTAWMMAQGWIDTATQNLLLGLATALTAGGWGHAAVKQKAANDKFKNQPVDLG